MRKIKLQVQMTVDGFISGQNGEIDLWLEQFRKIWETRFNPLDGVLNTMKKSEK